MGTQLAYWIAGGVVALIVVISGLAEHRRNRRRDLDAIGWVPWRGIQVCGMFALALIAVLAFHR